MKNNARQITHNGKTQSIAAWSRELNIDYRTLQSRLRAGWSVAEALNGRAQIGRPQPLTHPWKGSNFRMVHGG